MGFLLIFSKKTYEYIALLLVLFCFESIHAKIGVKIPAKVLKKFATATEECTDDDPALPNVFMAAITGELAKDDDAKKALQCFAEKSGYGDKDGYFNVDVIIDTMPVTEGTKEQLKDVIEKCNQVSASSPAETSFKIYECAHKSCYFTAES